MARKPRIHVPGAVYHVILRGNARQKVFTDDKDRLRFYTFLGISAERSDHRILAFCLMTDHIHLQIQVGEIPLSKIMQNISMRYTKWFNWRHNKVGHVFQGRYKAIMVDADDYLLQLASYINLNPVRAKITDRPEKYRWSSYRAYLGRENLPWLDTKCVLSMLSTKEETARGSFASFVEQNITEGRRKEFHGEKVRDPRVYGENDFVKAVLQKTESPPLQKPDILTVLSAVKRVCGLTDERLMAINRQHAVSEARGLAAWATLELSAGTLAELAPHLGRAASTLSKAARTTEERRQKDPLLAEKTQLLRNELQNAALHA